MDGWMDGSIVSRYRKMEGRKECCYALLIQYHVKNYSDFDSEYIYYSFANCCNFVPFN